MVRHHGVYHFRLERRNVYQFQNGLLGNYISLNYQHSLNHMNGTKSDPLILDQSAFLLLQAN